MKKKNPIFVAREYLLKSHRLFCLLFYMVHKQRKTSASRMLGILI